MNHFDKAVEAAREIIASNIIGGRPKADDLLRRLDRAGLVLAEREPGLTLTPKDKQS